MIEVSVARLGLDSVSSSYVVILQEKGGDRLLPIWIGQPEAESHRDGDESHPSAAAAHARPVQAADHRAWARSCAACRSRRCRTTRISRSCICCAARMSSTSMRARRTASRSRFASRRRSSRRSRCSRRSRWRTRRSRAAATKTTRTRRSIPEDPRDITAEQLKEYLEKNAPRRFRQVQPVSAAMCGARCR